MNARIAPAVALPMALALAAVLCPRTSPAAEWTVQDLFVRGERGSGVLTEREFPIGPFDRLDFGGAFRVRVRLGSPAEVRVRVDDNLADFIVAEVRGRTLVLETSRKIRPSSAVSFWIVVPSLAAIEAGGASRLDLEGYEGRELELTLSGASEARVEGRVEELDVRASGASEGNLEDLVAARVRARASGASDLGVHATASLSVRASGASDVRYLGEPAERDFQTSGASEVRSAARGHSRSSAISGGRLR